jgi:uncharacterized protein (DUF433 family)
MVYAAKLGMSVTMESARVSMNTRPSAIPLYNLTEAARYTRTDTAKVRRWIEGYEVSGRRYQPLLKSPSRRPLGQLALSFENLIEIALVASLQQKRISLQVIREAQKIATGEFGQHAFARQSVYVSGKDIFMEASERVAGGPDNLTALTKGGQRALEPVLKRYLTFVDWEDGWPAEWRPLEGVVRQNPQIVFGLPNVRGVRTEIIRARFEAPESIDFIAQDYGLTEADVQEALRYEFWLRPAA